mmetsp:Transcript_57226/g.100185  ORF Transcript_57226/g.100185 Transcript_57226/m.100185 type:complete len:151 (-) Transcript_57226:70-522(-)
MGELKLDAMPKFLMVTQRHNPNEVQIKVKALAESDLPHGNYAQWSLSAPLTMTVHMDPSSAITCETVCNMMLARAEERLAEMREEDLQTPSRRGNTTNLASWTCSTNWQFRGGPADMNAPLNTEGHEYDVVLRVEGKFESKSLTQCCCVS